MRRALTESGRWHIATPGGKSACQPSARVLRVEDSDDIDCGNCVALFGSAREDLRYALESLQRLGVVDEYTVEAVLVRCRGDA